MSDQPLKAAVPGPSKEGAQPLELGGTVAGGIQLRRDPVIQSLYGFSGKIGILGGSFDPVQLAHLLIARTAREQRGLDAVVFIPNFQNPLKDRKAAGAEDRMEMLKLAVQNDANFYVCPVELNQKSSVFTVDTIREIRKQVEKDASLYFIAGSDCLSDLHRWREVHSLLSMVEFTPFARGNGVTPESIAALATDLTTSEVEALQRNAIFADIPAISSTEVRERVAAGDIPYEILPDGVGAYIAMQQLYSA